MDRSLAFYLHIPVLRNQTPTAFDRRHPVPWDHVRTRPYLPIYCRTTVRMGTKYLSWTYVPKHGPTNDHDAQGMKQHPTLRAAKATAQKLYANHPAREYAAFIPANMGASAVVQVYGGPDGSLFQMERAHVGKRIYQYNQNKKQKQEEQAKPKMVLEVKGKRIELAPFST
jgi:hypothetical protein